MAINFGLGINPLTGLTTGFVGGFSGTGLGGLGIEATTDAITIGGRIVTETGNTLATETGDRLII